MYLRINAFALTGRTNDNTIIPRVSLRLPWAMRSLGFQPVCMSARMVSKHIASLEAAALLSRMGSNLNGTWIVDTHS